MAAEFLKDLKTSDTEQSVSSPTGWFSSIATQDNRQDDIKQTTPISYKINKSIPKLEAKLEKCDSTEKIQTTKDKKDVEQFNEMSLSSGLKTTSFYGGHPPAFQFGIKTTPNKKLETKEIKNNGHVKRNSKRKRTTPKNANKHVLKKTKKHNHEGVVEGELHKGASKVMNGVDHVGNNGDTAKTILDITPESSPSDYEDQSVTTTNGFYTDDDATVTKDSNDKKLGRHDNGKLEIVITNCRKKIIDSEPRLITNTKMEELSETGSQYSEDSLVSGFGSINGSTLIKGENGEYYFSNSNENSPDLTVNGPSKFFQTPTNSQSSPDSNSYYSLSRKDKTLFLFGKDSEGSSYSPSNSSSNAGSPERQTSITSFFKPGNADGSGKTKTLDRAKRSNKDKKKMEQMYLDLGQRNFGHVTCTTCGMVYTHAQPDDEVEHIRHHKKFVNGLRFNGWKDEHVVKEFSDGRIIMIKPDDPISHQKKAEEIRKVVDSELGFAVDLPYRKNESKTFLFIAKKRVVGCCVATQIDKGYPVLPSTPNKDSTPDRQIAAWCCSTVPVPAQCGISKIWVWNNYRRKKVATRLIECVRTHFIYGCVIPKDVVAFSDPTPDGKRLATAYIGTPEFLVFH